jgi:hypothetical protein
LPPFANQQRRRRYQILIKLIALIPTREGAIVPVGGYRTNSETSLSAP